MVILRNKPIRNKKWTMNKIKYFSIFYSTGNKKFIFIFKIILKKIKIVKFEIIGVLLIYLVIKISLFGSFLKINHIFII